jgi:hypothetical protein
MPSTAQEHWGRWQGKYLANAKRDVEFWVSPEAGAP